jgi:hypothetical protein
MASLAVPLSDEQKVSIRFHLGYGNRMSDDSTLAPFYRFAELEDLDFKMDHLTQTENTLVGQLLTTIETAFTNWQTQQNSLLALSVTDIVNSLDVVNSYYAFYVKSCQYLAHMIRVQYRGMEGSRTQLVV